MSSLMKQLQEQQAKDQQDSESTEETQTDSVDSDHEEGESLDYTMQLTPEQLNAAVEAMEQPQQPEGVYSMMCGCIRAPNLTAYPWPMDQPFDHSQVQERHEEYVHGFIQNMIDRGLATVVTHKED